MASTGRRAHRPTSSSAAAAIYPDHDALLESSTLFKVEGTFLSSAEGWVATGYGVGGRAEKQGYAYMMLEEGSCVDMLHWIVGIADAFKVRPASSLSLSLPSELTSTARTALRPTAQLLVRPSRPQLALLRPADRPAP